mgnify:CR=1 FL=1
MNFKKLKKNFILFCKLERYALLILGIQIGCFFLEVLNIKYIPNPYLYIYLLSHVIAGIYYFIKMAVLFLQWPRKKRFHEITLSHYAFMKNNNRHINKAKLSAMNSPCEKITRNEVYELLKTN